METTKPKNRRTLMTDFFDRGGVSQVLGVASLDRVANDCTSVPVSKALSIMKHIAVPSTEFQNVQITGFGKHKKNVVKRKSYSSTSASQQVDMLLYIVSCGRSQKVGVDQWNKANNTNISKACLVRWLRRWKAIRSGVLAEGYTDPVEVSNMTKELYCGLKKRGRPNLLPDSIMKDLLDMLRAIRKSDGRVTPLIVMSVTKAILKNNGRQHELVENGGTLDINYSWARNILVYHLQWASRKATTDRKLTVFEQKQVAETAATLEANIMLYHPTLVIEMDET
jgi:hypothetical protein